MSLESKSESDRLTRKRTRGFGDLHIAPSRPFILRRRKEHLHQKARRAKWITVMDRSRLIGLDYHGDPSWWYRDRWTGSVGAKRHTFHEHWFSRSRATQLSRQIRDLSFSQHESELKSIRNYLNHLHIIAKIIFRNTLSEI